MGHPCARGVAAGTGVTNELRPMCNAEDDPRRPATVYAQPNQSDGMAVSPETQNRAALAFSKGLPTASTLICTTVVSSRATEAALAHGTTCGRSAE